MTTTKAFTTGTRVFLFITSLYTALWSIALLLHLAAVRLVCAVVILLIAVGALLATCAWMLRRLWSMSGKWATLLTQKDRASQGVSFFTRKSENEAQA